MFYEYRAYDIAPGQLDAFMAWGEEFVAPILFERFGMQLVGRWEAIAKTGEAAPATNFHWILAWESEEAMRERWDAVHATNEWKAAWGKQLDPETGKSRFIRKISSTLMRPLAGSPLQ